MEALKNLEWGLISALITLFICVVIILINLIKAIKHGLAFTLGSFVMIASCIALAVVGSRLGAVLLGDTLLGLVKQYIPSLYEKMVEAVPASEDVLPVFTCMIVGPVLLPILFCIFRSIMQIFAKLIRGLFELPAKNREKKRAKEMEKANSEPAAEPAEGEPALIPSQLDRQKSAQTTESQPPKKRRSVLSTILAALVGLVCGCMVIVVLFATGVGFSKVSSNIMGGASDVIDSINAEEGGPKEDDMVSTIFGKSGSVLDNFMNGIIYQAGGKQLFNLTSTYSYDGHSTGLIYESEVLGRIAKEAAPLTDVGEGNITTKHSDAIKGIVREMGTSYVMTPVIASAVSKATSAWTAGETYVGMACPNIGGVIQPTFIALLNCFTSETGETLTEDLLTVADVIGVLVENKVFDDPGNYMTILSNMGSSGCLDGIMDIVEQNSRLNILIVELENLTLRIIGDMLGVPESSEAVYNQLNTQIKDAYNALVGRADDAAATFSKNLTDIFMANGIKITTSMADSMAMGMMMEFGGQSVDEQSVALFFATFADSAENSGSTLNADKDETLLAAVEGNHPGIEWLLYMSKALEEKNAEQIHTLISQASTIFMVDMSAYETEICDLLEKEDNAYAINFVHRLGSPKTIETAFETIAELQHRPDEIGASRAMISFIVTSAKTLVDELNIAEGEEVDVRNLMVHVGELLDKLNSSAYDKTDKFLLALVESNMLTEGLKMNAFETKSIGDMVNEKAKEKNVKYGELLPNMYDVVVSMTAIVGSSSQEEQVENIKDMITNLTPETAEVLASIAQTELLDNLGVPEEAKEGTANVVSSLFTNLAEAKTEGMTEEEFQKEADSINSLLSVSLSTIENGSGDIFGENSTTNIDTDKFLETVMSSTIVTNTIKDSIINEQGEEIADPLGIGQNLTESDIETLKQAEIAGGYTEEQINMLHTFLGITG